MTKPRPNRLGMYADVRSILDSALAAGGGEYECPDHGSAVHWRQRAYRFRKLYAETISPRESPYDAIVMPRPQENIVRLTVRTQVGVFRPAEGQADGVFEEDPLLEEALALAKKIEGGA